MIDACASALPFPLRHVWHEDRGFRLAEIRNRAVLQSAGGYCVFLDGDCIPPPGFVAAHRRLAEPGWFVAGNRALLSPALSGDAVGAKTPTDVVSAGPSAEPTPVLTKAEVLAQTDIFLPSGEEILLFTEADEESAAVAELLDRGVSEIVIKRGDRGASQR